MLKHHNAVTAQFGTLARRVLLLLLIACAGARAMAAAQTPDAPSNPQAYWQTLSKAHRAAAAEYPQNRIAKERWASMRMRSAQIQWALTTDPVGISASDAARIVYDYARWRTDDLTPMFDQDWQALGPDELVYADGLLSEATTYIRRAIVFDSQLVPAYRDLADLLRKSASLTWQWDEKQRILAEVRSTYDAFVRLGGVPDAALQAYTTSPPAPANASVCDAVKIETQAGRLVDYVSNEVRSVKSDWGLVDIQVDNLARGGATFFVQRAGKPTVDLPIATPMPAEFQTLGYDGHLGILSWRGVLYFLYYRDLAHPVALSKIGKRLPIVCAF